VKSLALVKYSLDVGEIKVAAGTHDVRLSGVPRRFGDLDKSVVEAAVRVKEACGGTTEVMCF
jgi:electron transfer flavoprotein alpha/beta subunit